MRIADMTNDPFRSLPQVERALEDARVVPWHAVLSRPLAAHIVADTLSGIREEIARTGVGPSETEVIARIDRACAAAAARRIHRVINGTGIVLHTNMGRAPLTVTAWNAAAAANTGYASLELDLSTGRRGKRNGLCPDLLRLLTGAESSLVVNNNAAAVLLMLTALARGREVVVSRGEQVQIGGGFRIPEILALSGARLVEVGTTNITSLADYTGAVTDATAMVLVVHTSNFKVRGFTEKPCLAELARALPPHVVLAVDQGSGTTTESIPGEERVSTLVRQGAHLVCFSGDKVLGGPQAGICVGRADLVAAMERHPLLRAFRPGKAVYTLLEQVLVERLNGVSRTGAALATTAAELRDMGERIVAGLPGGSARLVDGEISTGGGSAPDESQPSLFLEIESPRGAEETLASLRGLPTPVIGIIVDDRVRLSLA
ncbi:MAG TPA: L-seryl-tRNA(Sec) selenium transferase, partial [Spirochaetia bacterium]